MVCRLIVEWSTDYVLEWEAHVRKVLQNDPGGMEWDLHRLVLVLVPVQNVGDVLLGYLEAIPVPHRRLQKHTDRVWKTLCGCGVGVVWVCSVGV